MTVSAPDLSSSLSPVTKAMPPPPFFLCSRRAEAGSTIRLVLAGELDLAAEPEFKAALHTARAESDRVLLDLTALTLIDCAALSTIFAAAEGSDGKEAVLVLFEPRGQVRRMLGLVGPPPGVSVLPRGDSPDQVIAVAA
jgi:anti-sigma B factor antagonist